jgi:hypothetical protein
VSTTKESEGKDEKLGEKSRKNGMASELLSVGQLKSYSLLHRYP